MTARWSKWRLINTSLEQINALCQGLWCKNVRKLATDTFIKESPLNPRLGQHQFERSIRAYDQHELVWRRTMTEFWWGPWILVKVNLLTGGESS